MTRGWELHHNFELYEDVLPVLAELRRHGVRIGLVSNSGRDIDEFVLHHRLDVDAAVTSAAHGKVKPDPSIFLAVLDSLGVDATDAVMVGDSPADDIEGALELGMRAFLVDRDERFPDAPSRLPTLLALPAALGLSARSPIGPASVLKDEQGAGEDRPRPAMTNGASTGAVWENSLHGICRWSYHRGGHF